MINRFKPHLYILLEDEAYRQIANGFRLQIETFGDVSQVMPIANGWRKVRDKFIEDYRDDMARYPERYIIMLVDFDEDSERFARMSDGVNDFVERVFILGVWSEPEKLNSNLGSVGFEEIGRRLAEDCENGTQNLWSHKWLEHNADELARMERILKPIFFP